MTLVETDSLLSPGDRNHARTVSILERYAVKLRLSPYALVELDMLLKSGRLAVESVPEFYAALGELLKFRGIGVYAPKPERRHWVESLFAGASEPSALVRYAGS